jgi:hypothetical protein
MKRFPGFMVGVMLGIVASLSILSTGAQVNNTTLFDPKVPVRVFYPVSSLQKPADGEVGKWVKTNRVSWNSSKYQVFIFKGIPLGLKSPRNYDRTQKYPQLIFFPGNGAYGITASKGIQLSGLNAAYNTANSVQINGDMPDENGAVFINFTHGSLSQYAYLNGLIIQAFTKADTPGAENTLVATVYSSLTTVLNYASYQPVRPVAEVEEKAKSGLSVYPYPLMDAVTVQVPLTNKILLLSVKISDISERVISLQQFREVPAGIWWQRIALNSFGLKAGTYFIYIDGLTGTSPRIAKI